MKKSVWEVSVYASACAFIAGADRIAKRLLLACSEQEAIERVRGEFGPSDYCRAWLKRTNYLQSATTL